MYVWTLRQVTAPTTSSKTNLESEGARRHANKLCNMFCVYIYIYMCIYIYIYIYLCDYTYIYSRYVCKACVHIQNSIEHIYVHISYIYIELHHIVYGLYFGFQGEHAEVL